MASGGSGSIGTKVFIGNLSKTMTSELLIDLFCKYGEVIRCDVLNGYAFLFMKNEDDANKAINELDGHIYMNDRLTIQFSTRSTQGRVNGNSRTPHTKIFVGNLTKTTDKQKVTNMFETYGAVSNTDIFAGYGFVHMVKEEEAFKAIKALNGYMLDGISIVVELSTANTQNRSRNRGDDREYRSRERSERDDRSSRYEPYANSRSSRTLPPPPSAYADYRPPAISGLPMVSGGGSADGLKPGESFARDLLQLYIDNPAGFDAYARNDVVRKSLNLPPVPVYESTAVSRRSIGSSEERFDQRSRPDRPIVLPEERYDFNPRTENVRYLSFEGKGDPNQRYASSSFE